MKKLNAKKIEETRRKKSNQPRTFLSDMQDTKVELLEELSDLHMGRWKKDYDNPDVLDGTSWEVTIKYTDGKKWKSGGCNAFPYNFSGFLDIMGMSELDI